MENLIEAIILGLIQGLTEFFPISSSGHLLLVPQFLQVLGLQLDFTFQNNTFDIVLHIATYFALIFTFRKKILHILRNWQEKSSINLLKNLFLSSIPSIFIGGIVFVFDNEGRQDSFLAILGLLVFGVLLIIADVRPKWISKSNSKKIKDLEPLPAFKIGIWESFALIKGVSRSGATLLGGLTAGLSREEALDYSFLASLPVFFILSIVQMIEVLFDSETLKASLGITFISSLVAFLSALAAIYFFRNFIKRPGILSAFGIYRLILGIILLVSFTS